MIKIKGTNNAVEFSILLCSYLLFEKLEICGVFSSSTVWKFLTKELWYLYLILFNFRRVEKKKKQLEQPNPSISYAVCDSNQFWFFISLPPNILNSVPNKPRVTFNFVLRSFLNLSSNN